MTYRNTFIFQPQRFELDEAIQKHKWVLKGSILDVGAGSFDRYGKYFNGAIIHLNVAPGPNTDLVGSAEAIPAPDASYDGILCTQMLGDVFDLHKVAAEFYRVLRPGGSILLTESFIDQLHDQPHDYWRFTPYSLGYLFKEAGFKSTRVEGVGGYYSTRAHLRTRYLIEKYDLYKGGVFRKLITVYIKVMAKRAMKKDRHNKTFVVPHSWIAVIKK